MIWALSHNLGATINLNVPIELQQFNFSIINDIGNAQWRTAEEGSHLYNFEKMQTVSDYILRLMSFFTYGCMQCQKTFLLGSLCKKLEYQKIV